MTEFDDQKDTKPDKNKQCPICQGTGFVKGEICTCISGKLPKGNDIPDFLKDLFKNARGGIFKGF